MKTTATNQSISWFYQRLREGSLELSPDFQRNPVWLPPQKEYLIETILMNLPIPEIYMVNRIKPSGESTYIIVDGQQRIRTILEFVTSEMVIKAPILAAPNVKKFNDLSDAEKQNFWRYSLVVRDLEDTTDDEIRHLFERLNKNSVVLNDQEMRNARFKGQFLHTIQRLSENPFWTSSGIFSSNDIRRMLDLEFISILLTTMIGGIYNRKERIDEFYIMYEDEFEDSVYYSDRFNRIIEIIDLSISNIKLTRWRNKAEFYTLFLVADNINDWIESTKDFARISASLKLFEEQVQNAKTPTEQTEEVFIDYLDAATSGTNDKEKRVRRFRILREYLSRNVGV